MNARSKASAGVEMAARLNDPMADGAEARLRYELSPDLVTLSDARPADAEAIRTLRTHIMARHLGDGRRGLAICGATAGVGCSFTAANLGMALSQVGISTLLIDGNLRAPGLEKFIRPSTSTDGLSQYLAARDSVISDAIHAEVVPNLSVMYAGGVAANAQELLGSDAFRRLIERCLRDFEFTIIDTPPGDTCADNLRISAMVGYTLIVARADISRANEVMALSRQLRDDGADVIGSVLSQN